MMRDGLILIDKEDGMTSHDVVALFRKRSRVKKVGHTGTLDPLATGLLVLCVGRATRLQSYLMKMDKTYEGEIQFGWATDTYDAAGSPTSEAEPREVDRAAVERAAEAYRGEIEQVPPAYSAKKIEGKRAYDLAREGKTPELQARKVRIEELSILSVEGSVARFRVRCSAGTYVRSLAHDLGRDLGVGAHLRALRRTAIGSTVVDEAMSVARLREAEPDALFSGPHFTPIDRIRLPFEEVLVDPMQEKKLLSGQSIIVKPQGDAAIHETDLVAVSNARAELVGLAEAVQVLREGGGPVELQPRVVLKAG